MIDTHCHLYSEEFRNDLNEIIGKAKAKDITRFYLPAIDSSTHGLMINVEESYPGVCYAMMGLHPCSVKEDYQKELNEVKDWLDKRKFTAIGEIGLDFYWDKTFTEQQYDAFRQQCALAIQYQLPIVIHSRNATDECIAVVSEFRAKGIKGIFHCFGGTLQQAQKIIQLGFYLGIGGVITYKNSGLSGVLKDIDLTHIVLETDAPYLAPVPYRGKRNESSYLHEIAIAVAQCKNVTLDEVDRVTTANAKAIFSY